MFLLIAHHRQPSYHIVGIPDQGNIVVIVSPWLGLVTGNHNSPSGQLSQHVSHIKEELDLVPPEHSRNRLVISAGYKVMPLTQTLLFYKISSYLRHCDPSRYQKALELLHYVPVTGRWPLQLGFHDIDCCWD